MSVISKVKLPDGNTYDLKDRAVLQSKTYTNVIASGNSDPAGWLYFFKAVPTSSTVQCSIKYRVKALVAGVSNNAGYEESVVEAHLYGASSLWYRAENTQNNTSYRAYYNHIVYRAKAAGITSNYGHIFGLRLQSAYNPTTAANSRTITFEILETENCTVTFFNSPLLYANVPGTGSTNFDGRTEYNATTQGDTHTGDVTNTARLTLNYTCYKAKAAMYRYVLLFTYDEQYLLPVNSVDNNTATTKTLTTQEFDPFGEIYFNSSTNTVAADGNMGDWWGFCVHNSDLIDYRYSFNTGTTLTARKGIYLVCSPQSNGKVKLHTTPISQTLPTTEDGLVYIYLGRAYDTYRGTLSANKPIYYYKNGALREWTNSETLATVATSGSYNDLSNKPTIPTVTDTYSSTSGNAMSGKAVNAALQTLDSSISATTGQAISAITITDGKIASSSKISVGETNQNAFSNVKVGSSTVAADSKTDTLELVAGTGIVLTPDTTNDKITIASDSSGFGGVEMLGITIPANGWSSGSYSTTVTSNAIATSDYLSVPQVSTGSEYSAAGVVLSSAVPNATNHQVTLTFTCTSTPTSNLDVVVLVSTSEMQTQIDLADAIANYPKIQNGVWYRWDVNSSAWVNTGVKAGITSIVQTTTSTADGGTNVITATLSDGTKTTFNIKNGQKGSTGAKGDKGDSGNFYFSNKAVAASAWVADTTYEDYPLKATVTCTGVTVNDGVDLVYGMEDATSGNFAPIANTVSNGVEIWAKEAAAITIPTIIIHPPANGSIATPTATWLDQVYPVGSVYTGSSTTNPGSLFGGSWTLISHVSQSINYASTINIAGSFPTNPLSTSTNTYTVPEDGWVYYAVDRGTSGGNTLIFWVDGTDRFHHAAYSAYANADMLVPVTKGQVLKFTTDGTSATWTIRKVEFYKNDYSLYNWRRTS